jgi:hypothetical protein
MGDSIKILSKSLRKDVTLMDRLPSKARALSVLSFLVNVLIRTLGSKIRHSPNQAAQEKHIGIIQTIRSHHAGRNDVSGPQQCKHSENNC